VTARELPSHLADCNGFRDRLSASLISEAEQRLILTCLRYFMLIDGYGRGLVTDVEQVERAMRDVGEATGKVDLEHLHPELPPVKERP